MLIMTASTPRKVVEQVLFWQAEVRVGLCLLQPKRWHPQDLMGRRGLGDTRRLGSWECGSMIFCTVLSKAAHRA